MGITEIVFVVASAWCVLLAFGTALFTVAARADRREEVLRESAPEPAVVVTKPERTRARTAIAA
jgi:hypothetical protein